MKAIISSTFIAFSLTLFLTSESFSTDKNLIETGEIRNITLAQQEDLKAVAQIYTAVNFVLTIPWKSSQAHLLKGRNDGESELFRLQIEAYKNFSRREQVALADYIEEYNSLKPEDKEMASDKYYEILLRQMFDSLDIGLGLVEKVRNIKGLEGETMKSFINLENEFLQFKIKLNTLKQKSFDIK